MADFPKWLRASCLVRPRVFIRYDTRQFRYQAGALLNTYLGIKRKFIYNIKRNLLAGQFPWLVQSYVIRPLARVTY
jgi:hypothetical protein